VFYSSAVSRIWAGAARQFTQVSGCRWLQGRPPPGVACTFVLIPLIVSECPGSVIREICELSMWFNSIYETSNHGLTATWSSLVEAMEAISTGSTRLEAMDTYKIAWPSSLNSVVLDTVTTFCTHNSRPIACRGLSKDSCSELLGNMLGSIFENFRACQSPENFLVSTTTQIAVLMPRQMRKGW
jgi:hypothetical protein